MDKNLLIAILSYNTKEITKECLKRVKIAIAHTQKTLKNQIKVTVVDNASTDGSAQMIEKEFPWVELIKQAKNTGFSGGNNIIMKKNSQKFPFILLLNSDCYLNQDTLTLALQFFDQNPNCDVLGCRLVFATGKLQPSAGFLPNPINTSLWISGLALLPPFSWFNPIHPKDPQFFKSTKQVEWVMGAFMLLKDQVYQKTHGFDESIFMYGEEVEWSKRIKDAGFKTWYYPKAIATHLDKASSAFMLEKPLLNEIKGIVRFFNTHYKSSYSTVKLIMQISLLLRIVIFTLLGNKPRQQAYVQSLKIL